MSNTRYTQTEVCDIADPSGVLIPTYLTGYAFRADSRYFVLAERHKSKDTLGVYDAHEAYRLVRVCGHPPISAKEF